jgi:hypothetical protein
VAGIVASTMANFSMCKDHEKPPLQPWDLMPWLERPPEPEHDPVELRAQIIAWRTARGEA